jgi:hypothetical protein
VVQDVGPEFKPLYRKSLIQKNILGRGWGQGGEMNQALYAHMNNKRKMKKKIILKAIFF